MYPLRFGKFKEYRTYGILAMTKEFQYLLQFTSRSGILLFMKPPPSTLILRHQRENLKKCSLRGLETRTDFSFLTYPSAKLPDLSAYILLALDGPPLSEEDRGHGLFLLDATWRYTIKMRAFVDKFIEGNIKVRSLPTKYRTAYPRYQSDCPDPDAGLASIEALYVAYLITGRSCDGLLDNYYWKDEFLQNISAHIK